MKLYFYYERMEPLKYPDPRDLRNQLRAKFNSIYKNKMIGNIPLSTEIVLKNIGQIPVLKYKVIQIDWEEAREMKDVKYDSKMFCWIKENQEYGIIDN